MTSCGLITIRACGPSTVKCPLSFDIEIADPPHEPDQRLVAYTVQPDSPTAHRRTHRPCRVTIRTGRVTRPG